MAEAGRNQPCECGSGRKAKRCCGVRKGPSEAALAKAALASAARSMAIVLMDHQEWELEELCAQMLSLPTRDLSLLVRLPKLRDAVTERLSRAIADDDVEGAQVVLPQALEQVDTPAARVQLARAVLALVEGGRIDAQLGAAAVIDLASGSQAFLRASLLQAVAVTTGTTRTPAGLMVVGG